jgi:predicted Zn-ribbon and HTH transcriptional regulator
MREEVLYTSMRIRRSEFERIRSVLEQADADEPLTAREILRLLEDHGEEFESAHRVATVLGRREDTGEVEVIRDQPYRYRFPAANN